MTNEQELERRAEQMLSKRLPPSKIATNIAHEMARHMDAGKSHDESMAEIQRAFPTATPQDMMRACQIGYEQVCIWEENRARKMVDLIFGGGSDAEFKAVRNAKPSASAMFPEPDKTKS